MAELASSSYPGFSLANFWDYLEAWWKGQPKRIARKRFHVEMLCSCSQGMQAAEEVYDDYLWNTPSVEYCYRNPMGEWNLPAIVEGDSPIKAGTANFFLEKNHYPNATLQYIGYGIVSRVGSGTHEQEDRISCPCWMYQAKQAGKVVGYFYFATSSVNTEIDEEETNGEYLMFTSIRAPYDQPVVHPFCSESSTQRS